MHQDKYVLNVAHGRTLFSTLVGQARYYFGEALELFTITVSHKSVIRNPMSMTATSIFNFLNIWACI